MSSNLFLVDESFIRHSSSDHMASSSDLDMQFLYDHLFPFEDPQYDQTLQAISIDSNLQIQPDPYPPVYHFSSSPPSHAFNNLSIGSTNKLNSSIPISAASLNGIAHDHFPLYETTGVKSEDCYGSGSGSGSYSYNQPSLFHKHSYFTEKFMQRSLSTQSLDRKPRFLNQPCFNSLLQTPSFESQLVGSPENSELVGNMRRVCSAGDIQRIKMAELNPVQSPTQFVADNSFTEEGSFRVRRYNAEEKKQRINRYRSKRTQRNFNKTIKYACRKTLADSRHRVRGRFARNDETGEIPKVAGLNREEEDEDELWQIEGLCEDEEEIARSAGAFNNCSEPQFQYFSY